MSHYLLPSIIIIMEQRQEEDPQVERRFNRYKKMKALMCTGWERQVKLASLNEPGINQQELKNRILRFFKQGFGKPIDLQGYFAEKYTPNSNEIPNLELRPAAIVVYGVDFMPTRKVLKYFLYFNPLQIVWLNDSSCILTFQSEAMAKMAITENCLDFSKKQLLREFNKETRSIGVTAEDLEWVQLIQYYELAFQRRLFARLATNLEDQTPNKQKAMYLEYQDRKRLFLDLYMDQKREREMKIDAEKMMRRGPREGGFRRQRHRQSQRNNNQRKNQINRQASESRRDYSFVINQRIKEQLEMEAPEQDQSVLSFVKRFENLTLQENQNSQNQDNSFHVPQRNFHNNSFSRSMSMEGNRSFHITNRDNLTAEIKSQQDLNLSFKKGPPEVIEISDDDDT